MAEWAADAHSELNEAETPAGNLKEAFKGTIAAMYAGPALLRPYLGRQYGHVHAAALLRTLVRSPHSLWRTIVRCKYAANWTATACCGRRANWHQPSTCWTSANQKLTSHRQLLDKQSRNYSASQSHLLATACTFAGRLQLCSL